jgi:hypothetical protein
VNQSRSSKSPSNLMTLLVRPFHFTNAATRSTRLTVNPSFLLQPDCK